MSSDAAIPPANEFPTNLVEKYDPYGIKAGSPLPYFYTCELFSLGCLNLATYFASEPESLEIESFVFESSDLESSDLESSDLESSDLESSELEL